MPFIFLHGVNNRRDNAYLRRQSARAMMFRRLVFEPLAAEFPAFGSMRVFSPYWGDLAATFAWRQACLPYEDQIETMGADSPRTAAQYIPSTTNGIPAFLYPKPPPLQSMQLSDILTAASNDLPGLIDDILSPIFSDERSLVLSVEDAATAGEIDALFVIAAQEAGTDTELQTSLLSATTAEEAINLLVRYIQRHMRRLANPEGSGTEQFLETQGSAWIQEGISAVREFFDAAVALPGRASSLATLQLFRGPWHQSLSRFVGDVLVYVKERGTSNEPGAIIKRLLDEIDSECVARPNEPLIFVTHSMGGNILYDILTYFRPTLRVDFWASVGGQVGLFEELKLFVTSDSNVRGPSQVVGLKPRVGYWLNVYDPADVFSFRVAPIFADVDEDVPFSTGTGIASAHSAYFLRPRFYVRLRQSLEEAFRGERQ